MARLKPRPFKTEKSLAQRSFFAACKPRPFNTLRIEIFGFRGLKIEAWGARLRWRIPAGSAPAASCSWINLETGSPVRRYFGLNKKVRQIGLGVA